MLLISIPVLSPATMGGLAMGFLLGYSSPAGPLLLDNSTDDQHKSLQLSHEEYSWFSSSVNLGAAAGGVLGGVMISTLGRRFTMMISVIPYLGGWALIGGGQNFFMLMTGRVLTGVCMGVTCIAVPTYIGEFASADIRGTLGSGFQVMVTVGILLAYIVGAVLVSWRWLAAVSAAPTLVYLLMMYFTKESPTFLLSKGKDEEANDSLRYFRGAHYNIQLEMSTIKRTLDDAKRSKASFRDILKPFNMKPLLICLSILFFAQCSGVTAVLFNMAIVFKDSGSKMSEAGSSVIIAGVQVVATVLGAGLMDKVGRRILLVLAAAFMSFSNVSLGVFFYMKEKDSAWALESLGWLPLTSLIVFITAYSVGFGPTVWVLIGELFSPAVKEASASLVTLVNWTTSFLVTLTFLPLQMALGDYSAFWLFGGMCLVALVFTLLVVPETKGKTLQEITAHFGGLAVADTRSDHTQ
nr:solute carrier family 2, facilitated glucose transporter member 8-like [Cherax quadricarinatus]